MQSAPDRSAATRQGDGWVIRRQRPDELASVMALGDLAFGAVEGIGPLVEALQEEESFVGDSFVAVLDDRLIGHAMLTRAWLDAEERLLTIPVLSPLSVHPDHQRRGVGGALVAYAIGAAADAGEIGVVLEGDPAYYSRLGFEPAEPWGLLRPSRRIPHAAFQWVRLPAHEPWMRGQFVYPDVFWRLDAVGLRGHREVAKQLTITTVTVGARDLRRLVRFYADLLDRPVPDIAGDADWVPIVDRDGGITLAVQLEPEQTPVTWPAGPGDQHLQLHLEIHADDLDRSVAHALRCGATLAEHQPQQDVRVMLDPEGHPFCLWVDPA